jgi:hypothetical protein
MRRAALREETSSKISGLRAPQIGPVTLGRREPELERTGPGPEAILAGGCVPGEHGVAPEDLGGARLLVSDVGVALSLLDEARYRAVRWLFGVPREQSWQVTLVAIAVLASAARTKSEQVLRGPGGPTRTDLALGAAGLRELVVAIAGPSAQDSPLVGTVVTIAVLGGVVRPGLSWTVRGFRTATHRVGRSLKQRYGHVPPRPSASAAAFPR